MRFLFPAQPQFFILFRRLSLKQVAIARLLQEFTQNFGDVETYARHAKEIEHEADEVRHDIADLLNKTFVTPFDREDINTVAHELDDVVDLIEDAISDIRLYCVEEKRAELDEFASLIARMSVKADELVRRLESRKLSPEIHCIVVEIHSLEDEGDLIFQKSIEALFHDHADPLVVIKWKDIFENLEGVADTYQHMSDTIEGVLVKAS